MLTAGIDIGSRTIKTVVLDGEVIVHREVADATSRPADRAREIAARLPRCPVAATGYGRDLVEPVAEIPTITEIKAHALGVRFRLPECTTIVDVGGQDLKVICLDVNGRVARFEMNDRCAAGTGRFLEIMAGRLGYRMKEFGDAALSGKGGVVINAMCTVFAESEVIGLVNRTVPRDDIARALHLSVVKKLSAMTGRLEAGYSTLAMSGGGALNAALPLMLGRALGVTVTVPDDPQIMGALGCAVAAARVSAPG